MKNKGVRANKTVTLEGEKYAVVSGENMANVHAGNMVFNSKAEADEYLKETVKNDPSQKGKIQLTPAFQMV